MPPAQLPRSTRAMRSSRRSARVPSPATRDRTPGLMEEIQVLWNVSGSTIWWRAEVTDIETTSDGHSQLSTAATIRYVSRRHYVAQDYQVKFLHSTSGLKQLQHIVPCHPGFITWKYPDEQVQVSPDRALPHVNRTINKKRQKSTAKSAGSTAPPSPSVSHEETSTVEGSQPGLQAIATASGSTTNRVINFERSYTPHTPVGSADNIRGESINNLLRTALRSPGSNDALLTFVKYCLKYECLHRFSSPIHRIRLHNSGLEGFQTMEVVAAVKSDMNTFLHLTRPLQNNGTALSSHRFNPDYSAFQHSSRATDNLSVDFPTLNSFLKWMQVNDFSDHTSFATKSSARRHGSVLRILGTSCKITTTEESGSAVDVDVVLPFLSCTANHVKHLHQVLAPEGTPSAPPGASTVSTSRRLPENLVFFRYRQHYDESQGRFLSPWKALVVQWPEITGTPVPSLESPSGPASQQESDATFSVQWSKCASLPHSQWTEDATYMGTEVMGEITAFFPSIVFFGPSTLNEIQALMSTHCF